MNFPSKKQPRHIQVQVVITEDLIVTKLEAKTQRVPSCNVMWDSVKEQAMIDDEILFATCMGPQKR